MDRTTTLQAPSSKLKAIGFIGVGHLALVYAVASALKTQALGTQIYCYGATPADIEREAVAEPGLYAAYQMTADQFVWTDTPSDLGICDLLFLALDVPTSAEGDSDLGALTRLFDSVAPHVDNPGVYWINLSQVPPGYTRGLPIPKTHLFYQVETLVMGDALASACQPARIMLGSADKSQALPSLIQVYFNCFACPIWHWDYETAELGKMAINLYLSGQVMLSHFLSQLGDKLGAVFTDLIPALKQDPRIGEKAYLRPGLGISSPNLQRDLVNLYQLSAIHGVNASVVEGLSRQNHTVWDWLIHCLHAGGGFDPSRQADKRVILGLSYKPGGKLHHSALSRRLLASFPNWNWWGWDTQHTLPGMQMASSVELALDKASLVLILCPEDRLLKLDWMSLLSKRHRPVLIDPFGILNPIEMPGVQLFQLGKGSPVYA